MTSTATSNLRLELQGIGDNAGTWGTNLNTALQMLDRANGAYGDIAIVDGTNTITVTDYTNGDWHYKTWNLTGALTTAADVVVPTYNKFWYVVNSTTGSQVVTVKVSGQTGVVVPDGGSVIVYCDGTDVRRVLGSDEYQPLDAGLTSIAGLTTAADTMIYTTALDVYATATITAAGRAILDDADASAQRTTLGLGTIATQAANNVTITGGSVTGITDITVADGGTGRSSHTAYALIAGGTTATDPQQSIASVGTSGQVLTSNGAGALPTFQAAAGGGDFSGPASSTDNALVRFDGTGGKTGQNSGWTLSDADALVANGTLAMGASQISGSNVSFTGGTITGITDLAVADGGTGASDAATARTNLSAAALGANTFTGAQNFGGFSATDIGGITNDTTDKGSVASGTVTFNVSDDSKQKLTVTGALTIAFAGWPTTGNYAEVEIELVNGSTNVTFPTINWTVGDGTTSTTFADTGITLASSGTNHIIVWSTDGGTTLYGVAS
jgi:hypothetical protein